MAKVLTVIIVWAISSAFTRIIAALGIGFYTYKGIKALVNEAVNRIEPLLSELPSYVLNILAIAGVPEALSILLSAVLTAAALGSIKVVAGVR